MMSRANVIICAAAGAVFIALAVGLVVRSREPGDSGHPSKSGGGESQAQGDVGGIREAALPSKKELGRGVLSEAQQRHLFRKIVGFDLPAHARDFEGAYYHDYYQRERQYYLSHTGYCTLPVDEGMALLDRVEDVWKARGGGMTRLGTT